MRFGGATLPLSSACRQQDVCPSPTRAATELPPVRLMQVKSVAIVSRQSQRKGVAKALQCLRKTSSMSNLQIELSANPHKIDETKGGGASTALVSPRKTALVAAPRKPAGRPRTSSWRRRGLWIGVAAAGGIGGWLYYAQPWQAGVPVVSVEIVAPGPVTRVLAVNGRIAVLRSVAVKSTVAGTLVASLAGEGDTVSQGAIIARLDVTS